jgi:hypothetical protein
MERISFDSPADTERACYRKVADLLLALPHGWSYRHVPYGELTAHAAFHCYYYFPGDKGEPVEPGLFPPGIAHGWIRDDERTCSFIGED